MSEHYLFSGKADLISLLGPRNAGFTCARFDWKRIIALAAHSKVSALLFYALKSRKEALSIPEEVYSKLQYAYEMNVLRNALIRDEFERLRLLFKKEGVPIILLKGIFFLRTLYAKRPGIRRLEDVDILVKEKDVRKAHDLLESYGYKSFDKENIGNKGGIDARKTAMYLKYADDNSTVIMPVHLHWHFVNISNRLFMQNWPQIDMADIWACALPAQENESTIFIMSAEHMLLALCEHGMRHGFSRLNILYDLNCFIEHNKSNLDWDKLVTCARAWGLSLPIYVGLFLTHQAFDTEIPHDFFKKLKPQGMAFLEKIFVRYAGKVDFPNEDMCILLYLAINPGVINKLKFIFKCISIKLIPMPCLKAGS